MRTFIYGTAYLQNAQRAELAQMWYDLNRHINPDIDLLVVDSFTDPLWINLIPAMKNVPVHSVAEGDAMPPLQPGLNWITFPENLGHLAHHGIDGWGRAFCRGIEYAIQHDYDYAVCLEVDLLFRPPVRPILELMQQHQIGFLAPIDKYYAFMENCICFMDVRHMKKINFIERYNWRSRQKHELPERIMEELCAPNLFYKNWQGVRDDYGHTQPEQAAQFDYLTHAHDQSLYYHFMKTSMPSGWLPPSMQQ